MGATENSLLIWKFRNALKLSHFDKTKDYSQLLYSTKKHPHSVQYLEESRRLWKKEGRKLEGERINCFFTWMAHLMCTKYNIVVVDLDITISSEKRKVASWDVNEHMRFFHAPNNVHFFQLKNQSILKCIVIDR